MSAKRKPADLYETLGVPIDASSAEVRRSYRSRAKSAHPDRGGSTEEFARVHRAMVVLTDPAKRAHYDETGEIEQTIANNADVMALQTIAQMLAGILDNDQQDPLRADLIAVMQKHLAQENQQANAALEQAQRALRRLGQLKGRFWRNTGPKYGPQNILERLLNQREVDLKQKVALIETSIKQRGRAAEILKDYSFDRIVDNVMVMRVGTYGTAFTPTTGSF